jgi:hypothetical protein
MNKLFNDNEVSESSSLINWIDDPRRGKASTIFREGVERQIAIRFETLFERLKTLNKIDNGSGSPTT